MLLPVFASLKREPELPLVKLDAVLDARDGTWASESLMTREQAASSAWW